MEQDNEASGISTGMSAPGIDGVEDWCEDEWNACTQWLLVNTAVLDGDAAPVEVVESLARATKRAVDLYAAYWIYSAMPMDTAALDISSPALGSFEEPADWGESFVELVIHQLPTAPRPHLVPVYAALLGMSLGKHGRSDVVEYATKQLLALDRRHVVPVLLTFAYDKPIASGAYKGWIDAQDTNAASVLVAIAEADGTVVPRNAIVALSLAMLRDFEADPDECYDLYQPVIQRVGMHAPDIMWELLTYLAGGERDVRWVEDMLTTAWRSTAIPITAKTSNKQREKAAGVFADLLTSYGEAAPEEIERFRAALIKRLERVDACLFGAWRGPDPILRTALTEADLSDDNIGDVVVVSFERGDTIRFWLDGGWHER